ncbi:LIM domain and actin-binding protein 1 [Podochytrium sp. JEL0797]|nr:LIM domain and actin-binding protein 1 [Podochytrium sp. JEL0797]
MRNVISSAPTSSPSPVNYAAAAATLNAATTPSGKPASSALAARLQKFESLGAASTATPPAPKKTSNTTYPTRRLSYGEKMAVESASMDPEINRRRSSVASQRESIGREKFEDSLPSAAGSAEALSPRIAEAIETLREKVLTTNQMSDVYVPPHVPDVNSEIYIQLSKKNEYAGDKCSKCEKTVYAMELIVYDSFTFHKNCLKCKHCNSTLKLGNVACLDNEFFCKVHFRQLFALKGNYAEGFGKVDPKKKWNNQAAAQ